MYMCGRINISVKEKRQNFADDQNLFFFAGICFRRSMIFLNFAVFAKNREKFLPLRFIYIYIYIFYIFSWSILLFWFSICQFVFFRKRPLCHRLSRWICSPQLARNLILVANSVLVSLMAAIIKIFFLYR